MGLKTSDPAWSINPEGHFDKGNVPYKRYLRELKLENAEEYTVGSELRRQISLKQVTR